MKNQNSNCSKTYKFGVFAAWFLFLAANIVATSMYSAHAEPYRPDDGRVVLITLPTSGDRALKQLREEWQNKPDHVPTAEKLARHYLRLERSQGEPRYLGYAEAVLKPWWNAEETLPSIMVIRAQIFARRHEFDRALADLDRVLKKQPRHLQALLSRSFILQSQGKISEAYVSCQRLHRVVRSLVSQICLARTESLGGEGEKADYRLTGAVQKGLSANSQVRMWALVNLAEIAWRRGYLDRADLLFRDALALNKSDIYLSDAYADLLLDLKRPKEVLRLLEAAPRTDGHLLRLALAARELKLPNSQEYVRVLSIRFAEAKRRGEGRHLREEARFELSLMNRPERALALALRNWRTQREPADVRLVLEACLAAGKVEKSRAVMDWLRRTGLEDRSLAPLVNSIRKQIS